MNMLLRKEKGVYLVTRMAKLAVVFLFVCLSASFIQTIWALYLDSFVNSASLVGVITALVNLVSFFSFFIIIQTTNFTYRNIHTQTSAIFRHSKKKKKFKNTKSKKKKKNYIQ